MLFKIVANWHPYTENITRSYLIKSSLQPLKVKGQCSNMIKTSNVCFYALSDGCISINSVDPWPDANKANASGPTLEFLNSLNEG